MHGSTKLKKKEEVYLPPPPVSTQNPYINVTHIHTYTHMHRNTYKGRVIMVLYAIYITQSALAQMCTLLGITCS